MTGLVKCVLMTVKKNDYTLSTPNYSSEEVLISSCKIRTGLHEHHFYFYRTDFAMKRSPSACATTSLNAVTIGCKLVTL